MRGQICWDLAFCLFFLRENCFLPHSCKYSCGISTALVSLTKVDTHWTKLGLRVLSSWMSAQPYFRPVRTIPSHPWFNIHETAPLRLYIIAIQYPAQAGSQAAFGRLKCWNTQLNSLLVFQTQTQTPRHTITLPNHHYVSGHTTSQPNFICIILSPRLTYSERELSSSVYLTNCSSFPAPRHSIPIRTVIRMRYTKNITR